MCDPSFMEFGVVIPHNEIELTLAQLQPSLSKAEELEQATP